MRRHVALGGFAILVLLLALVVPASLAVRATEPVRDGVRVGGVEVVKDGFVSAYLLEIGDGEVALVDAGDEPDGAPVLEALARRGLDREAIQAILLTHGDPDHVGAALALAPAPVLALEPDVPLAEGRENRSVMRILPASPTGLRVHRALHDGDSLQLSGVAVRVFALPGHSAGSAAYLASGVLFLGDACVATKDGRLAPGWTFTHSDTAANAASLRRLAARLGPEAGVRAIACSHSALLQRGLTPLLEWAAGR